MIEYFRCSSDGGKTSVPIFICSGNLDRGYDVGTLPVLCVNNTIT